VRLPADEADKALIEVMRLGLLSGAVSEVDVRASAKIFVKER